MSAAFQAAVIEPALTEAVAAAFRADAADPVAFVSAHLGSKALAAAKPAPPPAETQTDKWSLVSWLKGAGVHRVVAGALQAARHGADDEAMLHFIRRLPDRAALEKHICSGMVLSGIVELVWDEVVRLKETAATTEEMQSKFAGEIELSYAGLDTFFGGLEGVAGPPSPKLLDAMREEHCDRGDSNREFVTDNYGICTTSKKEFLFVHDEKADGIEWPVEEKLPDRSLHRTRILTSELLERAEPLNAQLKEANQPLLVVAEVVAANLYTGPCFQKYNSVLRGLRSESEYLKKKMVELCCPKEIAERYPSSYGFEEACHSINKYTTTLHGINSATIKMGKLTKATKVYRGISGKSLPADFWKANKFNVRGGVENAFMSTTLDRSVALHYASGSGMGILIEVQQGMVNRGADISSLSQYPHEQEILFGPLTGIEVLNVRTEASVVFIECAFSINLTALTLEQVLGKRQKVVADMCGQLEVKARQVASSDEWSALPGVPDAACLFLKERLQPLAAGEAEQYNENAPLGEAIAEAVAVADDLGRWLGGLADLAKLLNAESVGSLVQSSEAVVLANTEVTRSVVCGISALIWARPSFELDLTGSKLAPDNLVVLSRALRPTVTSLLLADCDVAKGGGNLIGVERLCSALSDQGGGLQKLSLQGNRLPAEAIALLANGLKGHASLKELDLADNNITNRGKDMSAVIKLTEVLAQTKIESLNLESNYIDSGTKDKLRSEHPNIEFKF